MLEQIPIGSKMFFILQPKIAQKYIEGHEMHAIEFNCYVSLLFHKGIP